MIVVSNTSPLMNMAVIGHLGLLERLYKKIMIPEAVSRELSTLSLEQHIGRTIQTIPWIDISAVANQPIVNSFSLELDVGEAEAIVLAIERKADLLLIDERHGRKIASHMGLKFIGVLGVLIEAKRKGFVTEIKPILSDLMVKAGFWMRNSLYIRVLREAGE